MTRPQGSGGLKYYEADRLSTRLVTSSTGAVLGTQDHLPFGDEAGVAGESEKHRFTNYERDGESGTDYAVNRQYGVNAGRYFQTDRLSGSASNPQSWNRYAYSLNDPVNLTDPLGLNVSADDGYDCTCTRYHYSNPVTGEGYWGPWSCSCTSSGEGSGVGLPQNPVDDCHRFASIVEEIGNNAANPGEFMQRMIDRFIGPNLNVQSGNDFERAANVGNREFGDSGFKSQFQDQSNQVRHFTGGLWAGYRYRPGIGQLGMNSNEDNTLTPGRGVMNSGGGVLPTFWPS